LRTVGAAEGSLLSVLSTFYDSMADVTVLTDACTLNNAMNAVQIAILIALLRWVRS